VPVVTGSRQFALSEHAKARVAQGPESDGGKYAGQDIVRLEVCNS
jgi:hypothetical protein